jgi:AcrR family transcriptional regulator
VTGSVDTGKPRPGRRRDPSFDSAIIEAVLNMISAGASLSGLSLVAIAREAGVSRNSLYRRWKSKDDLYLDVLDAINRPIPALTGITAKENVTQLLAVLIDRALDERASRMLRVLNAEAEAFPELHRRYLDEIIAPRRDAMNQVLHSGTESGELRADIDIDLVAEVLVGPVLTRMAAGTVSELEAKDMARRITDLVFRGCAAPQGASRTT